MLCDVHYFFLQNFKLKFNLFMDKQKIYYKIKWTKLHDLEVNWTKW